MRKFTIYDGSKNIEKFGDSAFITFVTDADKFVLNYSVSDIIDGVYPHVGVTARRGLAILYREYDINSDLDYAWKPFDVIANPGENVIGMKHIVTNTVMKQIAVYGPILSHLDGITIQLDEKYNLLEYDPKSVKIEGRGFTGGGYHTFGLGVTSAAMMFSNIMKRNYCNIRWERLSTEHINRIGNVYELILGKDNISDYAVIILELSKLDLFSPDYILKLFTHLSTAKHVILWNAHDKRCWVLPDGMKEMIFDWCDKNSNFTYLDMDYIFSEPYADLCTYSKNFINDAANIIIYKALEKKLEELAWNT